MASTEEILQVDLDKLEVQNTKEFAHETPKKIFTDRDTLCGIGLCTPSGVQRCAKIGLFTASAGIASLSLQILSIYVSSQITSLEKQFGLSSTDSGILLSCNDIGFFTAILFFCHFGRKGHIPRILAVVGIIYGLAGVVCSLTHFIEPASLPKVNTNNNNTANLSAANVYLCTSGESTPSPSNTCKDDGSSKVGSSKWVVYVLGICLAVQGICKSPRTPLSTVYIDNNVPDKNRTGFYLGVIFTLTMFGPALAFTLGGVFSRLPVDLQDTQLTPSDPRWIGAWWLGFLSFGIIAVVVALPLFFFPKYLKTSWKKSQKYVTDEEQSLIQKIKGLPTSVIRVLRSPIYTLTLFASTLISFAVGGYISFGPKYLENVFFVPAWKANVIQGIQAAIAVSVGTFFGGYLTSRLKLDTRGCLTFATVVISIGVGVDSLNFVFGCTQPKIYGFPSNSSLIEGSSAGCECDDTPYLPVCGVNTKKTYFSPCHAGCRIQNETIYGECISEAGSDVTIGICDTGCSFLYPYVVSTGLYVLIGTFAVIPSTVIMIRSVPDEDRSMAVGINSFAGALLGLFPAPIVYGKVIDTTCRLWNYSCGTRGSCALYDLLDLRIKTIGMNVGVQGMAGVLFGIALFLKTFVLKSDKSEMLKEDTSESSL